MDAKYKGFTVVILLSFFVLFCSLAPLNEGIGRANGIYDFVSLSCSLFSQHLLQIAIPPSVIQSFHFAKETRFIVPPCTKTWNLKFQLRISRILHFFEPLLSTSIRNQNLSKWDTQ